MQLKDVSIDEVLSDPHWFLDDMDTRDGTFSFAKVDASELSALPFLAQNWDRSHLPKIQLKPDTVLSLLPAKVSLPRLDFIWHTGLCCSTLISRMLERPCKSLVMREPQVLLILAELKRYGYFANGRMSPRMLDAAFRLFARPFDQGSRVVLKPANAASFLVPEAAKCTRGKALFLYSDCRTFLLSIARKRESGMRFARRGFRIVAGDGHEPFSWPMAELMQLSDLRIAALYWHMQIAEFQRSIPLLGEDRAVSLDCDAFLARPGRVLAKLDEFFALGLGTVHVRETICGPLLTHDAKAQGEPFSIARRMENYRQIAGEWGEDLDEIVAWSYEVCPKTPRGMPLPNAIATIEKSYHP